MIKRHIPNLITCGNLVCGCFAILSSFAQQQERAVYLIFLAAILDFLDGFAARVLKVQSPLGKQLDSLADMVTFGVAPGILLYHLMISKGLGTPLSYISFSIIVFSALRLAKFNIDTRQTHSFIGLPTPANTLFISSLILLDAHSSPAVKDMLLAPGILVAVSIVFSLLMIAEIPMFSLKFKNFRWTDNKVQFLFLGISLSLMAIFFYIAIPIIIILYVVLSALNRPPVAPVNTENPK